MASARKARGENSKEGNAVLYSTPVRVGSPLVRRSIAITPIAVPEAPPVDARQERLSTISKDTPINRTARSNLENTNVLSGYKDCFMSSIKLFQSNKITKQNIWDLNLIRDFYHLVNNHDPTIVGDLHLASIALDASTKIYSMRVDDVHQDIVRLASGLMRSESKNANKKLVNGDDSLDDNDRDDETAEDLGDHREAAKKTPRTRRKPKSHIVTDLSLLDGDADIIPELDELFTVRTAIFGDAAATDKMYLLTLNNEDNGRLVTDLGGSLIKLQEPILQSTTQADDKGFEASSLKNWRNSVINPSLANFSFLECNPEQNISVMQVVEDLDLNSSQQEIAFDINADVEQVPHECNEGDNDNDSEEFVGNDNREYDTHPPLRENNNGKSYSYNPHIMRKLTHVMRNLYAGPLHWKLPSKRRISTKSLYSDGRSKSNSVEIARVRCGKKKVPHVRVSYDDLDDMFVSCSPTANKIKGSVILAWNPAKTLIPDDLQLKFSEQNRAFVKPALWFNKIPNEDLTNVTCVDDAVPGYNYDNENDNNFCARVQNDDLYSDDDNSGSPPCMSENVPNTQDVMDAPELVNKVKIKYDTKAKSIDMKLIKNHTWRIIESNLKTPSEGVANKDFIMFSEVYAGLCKCLPRSEAENLSIGIASLAVMHMTNDHGLRLEQDDMTDFRIMLGNKE